MRVTSSSSVVPAAQSAVAQSAAAPSATQASQRKSYSFDEAVGIPKDQEADLQSFYDNFFLEPSKLQPETILVARRFFQRHISNIIYYNRKIKEGNRTYWSIIFWSVMIAAAAPVVALLITSFGAAPGAGGPALTVAVIGVVLSGIMAGWKLIQSLMLANLRLNEWRRTAQKLRSELYRLEGKRRAAVEAKKRIAENAGNTAGIAAAAQLTPDEEATLRDELQAAITAAEAIVEAEVEAHFAAIYDVNKLSVFATSIPTSIAPVEKAFEALAAARTTEATKRGEAEAADRKLERLQKAREERAKEYQDALAAEIDLTADGKPWDSGDAKPKTPQQLGELIVANKLRKRLVAELDAIDAEWNAQRKAQRDRPA